MNSSCYHELLDVVLLHKSDIGTVCKAVWEYILEKGPEQQKNTFVCFLQEVDFFDVDLDDETPIDFEKAEPEIKNIYNIEKRIVEVLAENRPTEEVFYHSLWEKINDTILFPDIESQVTFLTSLWTDTRIPYYQLEDGCSMSNDEYQTIMLELRPLLKKANFIIDATFQQRTQRASLLLNLADTIEDKNKRIVFWAYIISRFNARFDPEKLQEILEKVVCSGKFLIDSD